MNQNNPIDLTDTKQVKAFINDIQSNIHSHIYAYEKTNDGSLPELTRKTYETRDTKYTDLIESKLAAIGITCSWPGLYPSMHINNYEFHNLAHSIQEAAKLKGIKIEWTAVDVMGRE